jgi:hypothetical protein
MNPQLARRLRELERKCADKLSGRRNIRIVWAVAGRVGGLRPCKDSEVVPDSTEGSDLQALDEEEIDAGR